MTFSYATSPVRHGRIDTHHHVIPPAFVEAMKRRGIHEVAGAPLPDWNPAKSLEVMDANGIQTAILSLSAPGVHFGDRSEAASLARRCNEYVAEVVASSPGRFGSFAVLPMPFAEDACKEAIHALDVLDADGIVLLGSTDGVFLGDARFDELMAELDRRGATVFVHPNLHATSTTLALNLPGFLIEFLCDTTRAAVNIVCNGTMERYPRIRWILAHAGGFLPYVAWRISLANVMPHFRDAAPLGVMSYLRRFYFDTALSPAAFPQAALRELVEPDHVLFGSDFPFAPAALTAVQTKTLDTSTIWDAGVRSGISRTHALKLFPRYAEAEEQVLPVPTFQGEGVAGLARRLLNKPLGAITDFLRNN